MPWVRVLPPLRFLLYKRDLPEQFQRQLGTFKPSATVLDHRSRPATTGLGTKVVGTNEFYVVKPSSAFASPEEAVALEVRTMLDLTTSPETKNLPEQFQGIFWMKGNGMQELAVLGLSSWDAENRMLTRPTSVGDWSWHDNTGGYRVAGAATEGSWNKETNAPGGMTYFKFEDDKLEQGRLWTSNSYNYDHVSWLYGLGNFSLEKSDFSGKRVNYKRGCYWAGEWLGYEWGSYSLTRITELDGTPIQPFYDEYVRYRVGLGSGTLFWKGPAPTEGETKKDS